MYDPKEEEFLMLVRRLAEIGYGRMMQIVTNEWSEKHPERALMESQAKTLDQFFAAKKADPLAHQWVRFSK